MVWLPALLVEVLEVLGASHELASILHHVFILIGPGVLVELVLEVVVARAAGETEPLLLVLSFLVRRALADKVIIIMCLSAVLIHLVLLELVQEAGAAHVLLVVVFGAIIHGAGAGTRNLLVALHSQELALRTAGLRLILLLLETVASFV